MRSTDDDKSGSSDIDSEEILPEDIRLWQPLDAKLVLMKQVIPKQSNIFKKSLEVGLIVFSLFFLIYSNCALNSLFSFYIYLIYCFFLSREC